MSDELAGELRSRFDGSHRLPSYARELADLHVRAADRIETLGGLVREFASGDMRDDQCIGYPRCQVSLTVAHLEHRDCVFCRARNLLSHSAPKTPAS